MAHFTQLGLSGSPDKKSETKVQNLSKTTSSESKPLSVKQKTAAFAAVLTVASLSGLFLLETSCSKGNQPASQATSSQNIPNQPALVAASAAPASAIPAATQPAAKKKSRQHKLSASTYANAAYGISFQYPKYANLMQGDKANLEWDGMGPVEMNFVQPGGTTVSAVKFPRSLYSGTDLTAAFFNVSVNPKLTSEECEQFAFPAADGPPADPVPSSKVKVGSTEFSEMEGMGAADTRQADAKYYHLFQNGQCYEFVLGLETMAQAASNETATANVVAEKSGDNKLAADQVTDKTGVDAAAQPALKPVDRKEVFRRLNWILSTVKIQPVASLEKTAQEKPASDETAPAKTATEKTTAEKADSEVVTGSATASATTGNQH